VKIKLSVTQVTLLTENYNEMRPKQAVHYLLNRKRCIEQSSYAITVLWTGCNKSVQS